MLLSLSPKLVKGKPHIDKINRVACTVQNSQQFKMNRYHFEMEVKQNKPFTYRADIHTEFQDGSFNVIGHNCVNFR